MPSADFKKKGTFADVVLPALLVQATNSRFTGMFRAERESIIKVIYFKEGEIAFASSNQPSDRLGEVLIKRGQLTREQLDMAMSKLEANVSLGRMLVELGYLSPKELLAGAKTQVEEILYSLNTWAEGTFEFVEGPLPPRIVDLKLNTRQVIFQCILQVDKRGWALEQIGSMDAVFAAEPELADALVQMRLEPDVHAVISNINGNNTVRDLAARSSLDEFTVTKIVAGIHLLNLSRVAIAEASGSGEYLARFGSEAEEDGDRTTIVNRPIGSETLPGLQANFEDDSATEAEATENDTFTMAPPALEDSDEAGEPSEDGAIAYEEEGYDEEEVARRRRLWLIPMVIVGLAAAGGAAWYFGFRSADVGDAPIAAATVTPAASAKPVGAMASATRPALTTSPVALATATPAATAPLGVPSATPMTGAMGTTTPAVRTPVTTLPTPPPSPALTRVAALSTPVTRVGPALPTAKPMPMATVAPIRTVAPPVTTPAAMRTVAPLLPTPTQIAIGTPVTRVATALPTPKAMPSEAPRIRPVPKPRTTSTPPRTTSTTPRTTSAGAGEGLAGAEAARSKLAAGDYRGAASAFRQAVSGRSGYALQLEIVCEEASVREGLSRAGGDSYFLLPYTHRGRSCYRVLWGVYPSQSAAAAAAGSVPEFFRQQLRLKRFPVVAIHSVR